MDIYFQENLTEGEVEDLSANRGATLLYVLKTVACSSSICEKRAIALLFQDYKERLLDMKLVGKVSISYDILFCLLFFYLYYYLYIIFILVLVWNCS